MNPHLVETLDNENFQTAVAFLTAQDPVLDGVVQVYGAPELLDRPAGFSTLVYTILEQQVSLASAKATFAKLTVRLPDLSPESLLSLSDSEMSAIGFSRQKARYTRLLADAIISGDLDLPGLEAKTDAEVYMDLTGLKGIGPWTANIYLLSALKRPNIWPAGDLALQVSFQELYKLDERPGTDEFESFGDRWKPFRAVAARILWQYYLSSNRNTEKR
ncbi:MAG: DNA-3-methyladenine glycosylase 2 family protein [Candidatus Marinimicrobia bacterium]|nr:DNA-3-methyladenine glycosylase 2 family protein [Candidatus Neomarinimicrobiota bacterium]MCF7850228.1 DNA-3-methyladenine glycosylase 2 family protein [Candidatus Neomarinimicrobiota bacterium]MCF7903730.1 DNA-3-methyladenine glycosylase 2 family protein [Candidatus Neomarinimicrobiota bacterium]